MRLARCLSILPLLIGAVSLAYAMVVLVLVFNASTPPSEQHERNLRGILTPGSIRSLDSIYAGGGAISSTSPSNETTLPTMTTEQHRIETSATTGQSAETDNSCGWRCNVHGFYYIWYRSKERDGDWAHWNHRRLPHWDPQIAKKYSQDEHVPENDDIGSSFWPQLGPYSSLDPQVISTHMEMMKRAGIGVVAVSWYPPGLHDPALDGRNETVDLIGSLLLDAAWDHGMRIAIHLEPYEGRDPVSVRKDFEYIHQHYGSHPALHRVASTHGGALLPLVYIYDSYHNSPEEWARLLSPAGDISVRGKDGLDCTAIFLWVEATHAAYAKSGFDGFYTYFAATGFVYGSTPSNWPHMNRVAQEEGIYFIPSVGPGYIDVEVRPWNYANTRDRRGGGYFDDMFTEAAKLQPKMVSITSFNEWHEGTNIEPAVDGKSSVASLKWPSREYLSYGTDPEFYLTKTRQWAERMFKPSHDVMIS
ncbi:hypothetical protein FOZ62_009081 [Perkinsus olseni]|uniref:Mannosidase, endo-alpha n=1 Tax=Perkinsus olseni TaxID=32597 RepID=A0A7J6R2E8_PEROL|nr:hypothetical protein FOZ62_009081 [Perkinsus olseni]